ncbi:MAG: phage major capsid domain-containing protein, partial [Candidatus Fonsibacter sp.]
MTTLSALWHTIFKRAQVKSPIIYVPADANSEPNPREAQNYGHRPLTWWSYANNVLAYEMNRPAGTAYYHKPRGSWKVKKQFAINNGVPRFPLITNTDIYVTFEVTEPLLLSPFIFDSGHGKQGFYGIQAMFFFSDGHEWKRESRMADCSLPQ